MERHIGKRLGIPCAVISAPVHVQDFPARHSPQMGWEGANVIFDTWIHPLVMGLEEHLLTMFREDFEFHDAAGPSHHGGHAPRAAVGDALEAVAETPSGPAIPAEILAPAAQAAAVGAGSMPGPDAAPSTGSDVAVWLACAEAELKKIPFFVRGKARRNTEKYAAERGVTRISVETLYEAKAHYAR